MKRASRVLRCLIPAALCLTMTSSARAAQPEATALPDSAASHLRLAPGKGVLRWFLGGSVPEKEIVRVLIVVHGYPHDLGHSLSAGLAAVDAAGLSGNTAVIVPFFPAAASFAARCSSPDTPPVGPDDAVWNCSSWIDGKRAEEGGPSAFEAMDGLLAELPRRWPGLRQITLAGFSAGAQFVQHYIGFARPPEGVALRYVVADPGSWLYFDDQRPEPLRDGQAVDWRECTSVSGPGACEYRWRVPAGCHAALRWKYGLQALPAGLAGTPAEIRARYAAADVAYLEGALDTGEGPGRYYGILDKSCAAGAQGPYRLQRGLAYAAYEREFLRLATPRPFAVVPGCAHDVACVLPSPAARVLLFPAQAPLAR